MSTSLISTIWQDSRPRDGEPVGLHPHGFDQVDVLRVLEVAVAGLLAGRVVQDLPVGRVGEGVPDTGTFAVLVPSAFDLFAKISS